MTSETRETIKKPCGSPVRCCTVAGAQVTDGIATANYDCILGAPEKTELMAYAEILTYPLYPELTTGQDASAFTEWANIFLRPRGYNRATGVSASGVILCINPETWTTAGPGDKSLPLASSAFGGTILLFCPAGHTLLLQRDGRKGPQRGLIITPARVVKIVELGRGDLMQICVTGPGASTVSVPGARPAGIPLSHAKAPQAPDSKKLLAKRRQAEYRLRKSP